MHFIRFILLWLLAVVASYSHATPKSVLAATELASRVLPLDGNRIVFEEIAAAEGNHDCYTISTTRDSVVIGGNNAGAMAVGLNHYLQRYCLATVSWYGLGNLRLPEVLPQVEGTVKGTACVDTRFFLNYCTYGYTMPFWGWDQWQKFIDWMAMSGVNMPLAITGQEAVWRNVWRSLGMSDDEVRAYFTGPAYLPWHRMANIDSWNGPLPVEWLDGQIELQQKILERERSLGMRPVLPAFAGHVPARLKDIYPDADIQSLGKWAGFDEQYSCHFLNPGEPLFAEIQKKFLDEQTRLFGTDHIYGVDPFNEVDPPSWEPKYLKRISRDMYKTLTAVDKDAIWLQMAWMFYHQRKDWTPERIKALLTGVPNGKMMLLDYHCENVELWKDTNRFHGQPYIWCYLGNFGGNTTLTGNVVETGKRLENTLVNGGKNLNGIGSTLEGLDIVQFPFEYVFDKAWHHSDGNDDASWISNLADRHVGRESAPMREAMQILFNEIYTQVPRTLAILPNLRPEMDNNGKSRTSINYNPERLEYVWQLLCQVDSVDTDAFVIDLVSVGRQVLGNRFAVAKRQFDEAYHNRDIAALRKYATEMQMLLGDIDALCSTHPYADVATWIEDARNLAKTDEIADYYERNARNLITTWGGRLNDYASRTLSGLTSQYYAGRWQIYIDAVMDAVSNGQELDAAQLASRLKSFEESWTAPAQVPSHRYYDPLTLSRSLIISR